MMGTALCIAPALFGLFALAEPPIFHELEGCVAGPARRSNAGTCPRAAGVHPSPDADRPKTLPGAAGSDSSSYSWLGSRRFLPRCWWQP
jgi:hypothetical protein